MMPGTGAALAGLADTGVVVPSAQVLLQVHFTGSNGSTTFTDESASARTLTAAGNAQIQSNLLELDGTNDWVTAPDHADWNFAGDFTLEVFGVVFDAVGGATTGTAQSLLTHWDAFSPQLNQRGWIFDQANGQLRFGASSNGQSGTVALLINPAWVPTLAQAYDLALVKHGANYYLYVDGSQIATATPSALAFFDSTSPVAIGGNNTRASAGGDSDDFDGRIAAVRITSGTARYTGASYTVPTLPLAAP